MTTRITHRFSKITRVSGALLPEDRIVVSQREGSVQKTANGTVDELYKFVEGQILTEGIDSIVNIGNGIIGKGTTQDPVRLDPLWLDQTLARKDHFTITRVGNRKTRYLPIARFSMFESATFNSTLTRAPYTGTIEASGELRIIQPATKAYTLSIGDWGTAGTVDSLQIIERKMQPNNLPEGYSVKGLLSKSKNAVVLLLGRLANPLIEEFWYASLTDGSLAEESYYNFTKIADRSSTLGAVIGNNPVTCAQTPLGGRMFFVALPTTTNPNSGIEIRAYTLGDPSITNAISELVNWNVSSYAGLFTGQNRIRVSDKFLGTGTEKCELLDKTNGATTVELLNAGPSTTRIQCIHNPDDDNDLYMIIHREHVLVQDGEKQTYVHDISLKLTVNYKTGIGSAIAIGNYLNNKPTIDAGWVYTNKRETFRSDDLAVTDSEVMSVLADGSVMLVGDTANGTESGLIRVRKSAAGWGVMNMVDIDAAVKSGNLGEPQVINPKPQYDNTNYMYKVFISSPINVYMNGTNYTIPAQVLDLTNERNAATPTVFTDMPYGKGEYAGLTLRVVYIYLQQAGKVIQLVKTHQRITESVTNTLLAVVYFGKSPVATALYGQAYSRMGKYRPSYVPMGSAVPVSYDHAGELPKEFWLQQASMGDGSPTFWADAGATTSQLSYASDGRTVYIRVVFGNQHSGRTFRLKFNDVDLGVKTFNSLPMIWQTTVVNKTTGVLDQPAVVYDELNNVEAARAYLNITPFPFVTDVVASSDGDDVITSVINNNPCYIRVRGYDLTVGDVFTVTITNPSGGTTNLGQATYQGYPMFFPCSVSAVGVHQVTTRNITRNQTPPNITFNVVPAITYYTPGQYNLSIPAGRTVEITLIGGGGGGGGSIHNYSSSNYWVSNLGNDGKDSKIAINANQNLSTTALVAGGGKAGIGANWSDSTSYTNGSAGEGGVVSGSNPSFTIISSVNGIKPPIDGRWSRQVGGSTTAPEVVATNNGAGGAGAWGFGDDGGGETIGVNTPITKVTEIAINTMVTGTATGVYAGKTYTILRGVNLRDAFVNHFNRAPESGELVRVTVPDNIALVGNATITQGLLVPANWEAGAMVEIINRGLIFGVGGNGNGVRYANGQPTIDGTNGGTGVHNLSTSLVTITNYGGIAGGGGGGARGSNYLPGGGGAPFGLKGVVTGIAINPAVNATDATFEAPGVGASDPTNSSRAGGAGGTVGTDGLTVIVPQWMNYYGNQYGTLAGYIAEGKVSVTNLDNGWTLGRPIQGGIAGFGGGGGSGAKLIARFTNNQPTAVGLTLTVGDYGAGWKKTAVTNGNNGDDGIPGYGIVEYV